jgi:hypothetical protein
MVLKGRNNRKARKMTPVMASEVPIATMTEVDWTEAPSGLSFIML